MQPRALLLTANQHAHTSTMPLMEDLRTAPLVPPTPGGKHAHGVVGHLLFSEGRFRQIMQGGDNQFDDLQSFFGGQSPPRSDGGDYQSYGELLSALQLKHLAVIALLETLTEDDFDQAMSQLPARH